MKVHCQIHFRQNMYEKENRVYSRNQPFSVGYETGFVSTTTMLSYFWSAMISSTGRQYNSIYPNNRSTDQHRISFKDRELPQQLEMLHILQSINSQFHECEKLGQILQTSMLKHQLTCDKPITNKSIGTPISTQFPSCKTENT